MLGDADTATPVAVFDLQAEGEPAARGAVYFKPAKAMQWPEAGLQAQLRADGNGFKLELSAAKFARATWIDFGDADADISDTALTLLPGESVSLHVSSKASLATLRKALRLRSLADAH